MRCILICCLLSILSMGQALAENLMIFVQCGNEELSYHAELKQAMSDINVEMLDYVIDWDKTIEEHALSIDSIVNCYRENVDSLNLFLLSDQEASFVAFDVLSRDTSIVALITLSGNFCNGDDYLYNEISIRKQMEMLDSLSLDGRKEQYLETAYNMIASAKRGKKLVLLENADNEMQNLYNFLHTRYGRSLLAFSLEERLEKIHSWVIPFYRSANQSDELDLNIGRFLYLGAQFGVKFTCPDVYNDQSAKSEVAEQVVKFLKK